MRSGRGTTCVVLGALVVMACSAEKKGASAAPDTAAASRANSSTKGSGASPGSQGPAAAGQKRAVLFLGTSLTVGLGLDADSAYPQQIQRKIDERKLPYETVNAGVSGETSAGLLRRLEWVLQHPAAVIVVETGANDGLRGQSVAATKATIGQILTRIRAERPEAQVVLAQMEAPTNLGAEYTRDFHAMFPALAKEHGVLLMPFLLDGVAGHVGMNQGDGVHPNEKGERVVAANVWKTLEPLLTRLLGQ